MGTCVLTFQLQPQGFLLAQRKEELLQKYRKHEYDTGSSAVQIAQLTAKVREHGSR